MEYATFSSRGLRRQLQRGTDDEENDLGVTYDNQIPNEEELEEELWFSGIHILGDQAMPVIRNEKASTAHPSHPPNGCRSLKDGPEEEIDTERCGSGCNRSTHSSDPFKPLSIQQLSRPPMVRSYGSSSGSSASTLMTPMDVTSWGGSANSPSYIETTDSIPTSSPYQLHILPLTKFAKDASFGEFPTSREFRFPSNATNTSPDSPELEWALDDHTAAMTLPGYSLPQRVVPKRSKKTRASKTCHLDSKRTNKALSSTDLPGLGIITLDGRYNEGITIPSKSRARHGPLTPEQRHDTAQMRRHGACRDCRKRKIKCNIRHRSARTESLSSTPPPPQEASLSFKSVALTVLVLQRCIDRRYLKLMILPDISDIPISEQISRQVSCFENMNLQGLDLQSSIPRSSIPRSSIPRSQLTTESSEANSINSFEDDLTEFSHEDSAFLSRGRAQDAGSEELLAAIQPFLDQLPIETAPSLSNELLSLFGIWLGNLQPHQQVPCDGTPSSSNSQNRPGNTPTPTNSTGSVPKRLSDDGSGCSDPSGNSGDGKRKRPRNVSQIPSGSTRRWACPYYQRDPHFYCVAGEFGDYRKCSRSPGFSEVHRVKQHLYDCHSAIYCTRCYSQFRRKEELVDHQRSAVFCEVRDPLPVQGLNENQKDLLKPRDRNKSEEERWKTVYKICFPEDQMIPSPYYVHYTQETAILRREILQIVEEEIMFVDEVIRERLILRLQSAFSSNAQNSGPSQSPVWSPPNALDASRNDGAYMESTVPYMSNPAPWSEWATRHTNPDDLSRVENADHHLPVINSDNRFTESNLESEFFIPDISSFGYNFETGHGNDGTGFHDTG